jgi:hypothetical protein
MVCDGGVTAMETSVDPATVSVVEPVMPPRVAVMVVPPTLMAVTTPALPMALLTVATFGTLDVHVTDVDMLAFEPSL